LKYKIVAVFLIAWVVTRHLPPLPPTQIFEKTIRRIEEGNVPNNKNYFKYFKRYSSILNTL
jgi:hypothetical protein